MISASERQNKFMADVANWAQENLGVLFDGVYSGYNIQLHHVVGRSYKQNKVHIGHDFILPVPVVLHDVNSNHRLNVTHFRKRFTDAFGYQRDLYSKMITSMRDTGYDENLPSDEILAAIQQTNR